MSALASSAALAAVAGCAGDGTTSAARTGSVWVATSGKDEFTDRVTKMVTAGEGLTNKYLTTRSLKFYPFVGLQDGSLHVGVRSGGHMRIPTGTVQLRVDDHPAWTISPDETPVSMVPALPTAATLAAASASAPGVNAEQLSAVMARSMSPYTATTGDKARSIVKQMVAGKVLRYRAVGFNQPASSTGEIAIDASFLAALREMGIDPSAL